MSEAEDKLQIHTLVAHRDLESLVYGMNERLAAVEAREVVDLTEVFARIQDLEARLVVAVQEVVEEALEAEAEEEGEAETEEEAEEEAEEEIKEDLEPESSHFLTKRVFGGRR